MRHIQPDDHAADQKHRETRRERQDVIHGHTEASSPLYHMDWLFEPIPLETEIEIEQEARRAADHPESGEIAGMMIRHAYKLQHMLNLAVMEIARLEADQISSPSVADAND